MRAEHCYLLQLWLQVCSSIAAAPRQRHAALRRQKDAAPGAALAATGHVREAARPRQVPRRPLLRLRWLRHWLRLRLRQAAAECNWAGEGRRHVSPFQAHLP